MVVTGAPPWFAAWCDGRDGVRVTQDDRPHPWTMYGAFHAQVDRRLGLYSGLISLPPGHSYRAAFEAALAAPGLQPGHDGRLHMDEQGVIAVAFQNAGALPIPLYELPFARGPETTLDFGGLFVLKESWPELQLGMSQDIAPRGPALDVGVKVGVRW